MIKLLSNKIAEWLMRSSETGENEKIVVAFGIEIFLMKTIHLFVSLLIGIFFGKAIDMLTFYLFFVFLRTYTGGYHAKSDVICFMNSCIMTILTLVFWSCAPSEAYSLIIVIFLMLSIIVIFALSPVADKNKPLDNTERKVYRKKSLFIMLLEVSIVLAFYLIGWRSIALVGATALFEIAVLLAAGRIKNMCLSSALQ